MRALPIPLLLPLVGSLVMGDASGQRDPASIAAAFEAHEVEVDGVRLPYRLLTPRPDQRDAARPLLVFLHGAGERGDDNLRQLTWLPERLSRPELRERFPCFLLALQCPAQARWVEVDWDRQQPQAMPATPSLPMRGVLRALDEVLQRDGVDPARVYLTGLSMGGYGTWDLAVRRADTFAAALAVCGGGDPSRLAELVGLPMQVWHGAADPVVPVAQSRAMAAAFAARAMPLQYFELDGVQHDSWRQAYGDQGGLAWLFAQDQRQQRRGRWAELPVVPRLVEASRGDGAFVLRRGARCHVPAELRRLASYLFDELDLPTVRRPSLVDGVAAVAGDLQLELDAELAADFTIEVGERLLVRARDRRGMADGCAALFQLLRAAGERGVRFGSYSMRAPAGSDSLIVDVGSPDWTREALRGLLRECWLGSVDEVFFVRDPTRHDPAAWREFTALAERVGVQVRSSRPEAAGRLVVGGDDDAVGVLQRDPGPGGFVVTVGGAQPHDVVASARALLPAAVERSRQAVGPVHAAGFRSRLIGRWRGTR